MWLGSGVAVAVAQAGSYSSDLTPSLGTPICHRYSPKKDKKKSEFYLMDTNLTSIYEDGV